MEDKLFAIDGVQSLTKDELILTDGGLTCEEGALILGVVVAVVGYFWDSIFG